MLPSTSWTHEKDEWCAGRLGRKDRPRRWPPGREQTVLFLRPFLGYNCSSARWTVPDILTRCVFHGRPGARCRPPIVQVLWGARATHDVVVVWGGNAEFDKTVNHNPKPGFGGGVARPVNRSKSSSKPRTQIIKLNSFLVGIGAVRGGGHNSQTGRDLAKTQVPKIFLHGDLKGHVQNPLPNLPNRFWSHGSLWRAYLCLYLINDVRITVLFEEGKPFLVTKKR